jgi:N-methylhydantoinase B
MILNPHRPDREELEPITTRQLSAGDVIRFERSGGGGYGPPQERSREAVIDDVHNGYISTESARMIYGCNVDEDEKLAPNTGKDQKRAS